MATAYDEVLYPGFAFARTHPDQLAVMATLFGLNPAPPERCRFLEIGCADGGNLIPMACDLPESSFFGVDLAQTMVEQGQRQIAELSLANIRLAQMDLMEMSAEAGTFDYIVAHGLYSWVPEPVRDKLMSLVRDLLAPQGVAYVSYNTLPGCRIREAIREMLLFHLRDTAGSKERIEKAREFLEALAQTGVDNPFDREARAMLDKPPQVLFHDELGEVYHPVYVREFTTHAGRFGLRFLCEASYGEMQTPEVVRHFAGSDRLNMELYGDFLRGRFFRRTLLCKAEAESSPELIEGRIPQLYAASPADEVSPGKFAGPRGGAVEAVHPLSRAVLGALIRVWPETLSFSELLEAVGGPPDPASVATILHGTFSSGLVNLHARRPRCVRTPGEFPRTTALVRWQAQRGDSVTTPMNGTVKFEGETERYFVTLLDGTRDVPMLASQFAPAFPGTREELEREIRVNLDRLARMCVLVR